MKINYNFFNNSALFVWFAILSSSACTSKKQVIKESTPIFQFGHCGNVKRINPRLKVNVQDTFILVKRVGPISLKNANLIYPKPAAGMYKFVDEVLIKTLLPQIFKVDSVNCSLRVYALVDTDGKISMDSIQVTHFPENMIHKNDSSLLDNFFISQFVYNISIVLTKLDHWKPGTVNSIPAEFLLPIDFEIYYED